MTEFTFTTAGESHGKGLITIIEGLPAGLSSISHSSIASSGGGSKATDAAAG